jgi:hypothetical protein
MCGFCLIDDQRDSVLRLVGLLVDGLRYRPPAD